MRELSLNEVNAISGGAKIGEYDISKVVSTVFKVSVLSGLVIGELYAGAIVGVAFTAAFITAKVADKYFFEQPQAPVATV